ncbi:MAG: heparan-alpha-glucosaminide N-acetyltransferase domain-containing protein [Anaeromyxobacteraceae bacterium]
MWLDWQRGLAVLFMIQWHVLDWWRAPGSEQGAWLPTFEALRYVGGFAAPGFMYMAGLSQALADAALERKGVAPAERRRRALGRALWVLGVSYGIRFVLFVLSWWKDGAFDELFKVDVLDVIAVGLAASAVLSVGRGRLAGPLLAAAGAAVVVFTTPLVAGALSHLDAAGGPWRAPNKLVDVLLAFAWGKPPRSIFCSFNWIAFVLAGAAVGPLARGPRRPLAWLALAAAAYGLGSWSNQWPPVYAFQNFWRASPSWFLMRLGYALAISGALQLLPDLLDRPTRWLTLLGRQSLVAYVASVQLTYGAVANVVKRSLSFPATLAGVVAMTALTWAICMGWERLQAWRKGRPRPSAPPSAATAA